MKVALVGLGYWGGKLLRNLVALVGPGNVWAVDARADRRAEIREFHPGVAIGESLETALADDAVRAVVIATPMNTHAELARKALTAGRHVLVEKPLASSVREAFQLAQLAEERGLRLMAGHTFLYSPRVHTVADLIEKGQIGRIHYVTSCRLNLGMYRHDANVIWDLAPHDFSIVFHLLGEFPVSLQTTARSRIGAAMPDVAFINMTFPSGAIASVNLSWLAPKKVRSTVVVGEQGMIVYEDTDPEEPVKLYDRGVVTSDSPEFGENQLTYRFGDTVAPHVSPREPLAIELKEFLSCVESGSRCRSDGWFGLEVVRALEAADRSWRLGGVPVAAELARTEVA